MAKTIDAVMIGRNDEKFLDESICSVRRDVDNVIYVDTGSSDSSVARAKKLGATVYHFPWCDDFSAARNFALSHSDSDWFLSLDCDERVTNPKHLRKVIQDTPHDILTVQMHVLSAGSLCSPFLAARMGKKGITYKYPIHEQMQSENMGHCDVQMIHNVQLASGEVNEEKRNRNILLLEKLLKEDDFDSSKGKSYFLQRVAEEYIITEQYIEAQDALMECLAIEQSEGRTLGSVECGAHRDLAFVQWKQDDYAGAMNTLTIAQKLWPKHTDFWFLCAGILRSAKLYDEAELILTKCLQMGDSPIGYNSYGGTGSWRALEALQEVQDARHVRESQKDDGGFQSPFGSVQNISTGAQSGYPFGWD